MVLADQLDGLSFKVFNTKISYFFQLHTILDFRIQIAFEFLVIIFSSGWRANTKRKNDISFLAFLLCLNQIIFNEIEHMYSAINQVICAVYVKKKSFVLRETEKW